MLRDLRLKRNVSLSFLLLCFLGSLQLVLADGSKDLYPADYFSKRGLTKNDLNKFRAPILASSKVDAISGCPFPTDGTMKVYAKPGEKIYVASSMFASSRSGAKIEYHAPDGTSGQFTKDGSKGLIKNREQELAGPKLPNGIPSNGYDACVISVNAGQEGVWEINFNPNTEKYEYNNTKKDFVEDGWTEGTDCLINAYDISVLNDEGTAFIPGRVYLNVLNIYFTSASQKGYVEEWYSQFYVLTSTGYLYVVDANGQNPCLGTFFANNKGIQKNYEGFIQSSTSIKYVKGGEPTYQSMSWKNGETMCNNKTLPIYDPRIPDNIIQKEDADGNLVDYYEDATHKLFFCKPAADMPNFAPCVYGDQVVNTWLISKDNAKDAPQLSNLCIAGKESHLPCVLGPEGVEIYFEANCAGDYQIDMDFGTDYTKRTFEGTCIEGANTIDWDGNDGNGKLVQDASISLSGKLKSAEIHFPFVDLDNNKNGLILNQLDAAWENVSRNIIYWDDSNLESSRQNVDGDGAWASGDEGEASPAHIFFYDYTGPDSKGNDNDAGDSRGNNSIIDTWTYAQGTALGTQNQTVRTNFIDLKIDTITCNKKTARIGEYITYTLRVENLYHENYSFKGSNVTCDMDADSASVGVWFPHGGFYTDSVYLVESNDPTCTVVQQPSGEEYGLGFINIKNGKYAIIKIEGYAGSKLAHKEILAKGFIMRPGDYFEVDANNINDDGMPLLPADTVSGGAKGEYDGIANNNLKDAPDVIFFLNSAPDATPDTIKVDACNTVEGNLLDNDSEIDADPMTITNYYIGENGSLVTPGTKTTVDPYGDITIKADGTYSFSATKEAGSLPNIYYIVSDGFEGVSGHAVGDLIPGIDTSFMKISIKQNQLPSIAPTSATIQAGTKVEVPISFTDPENVALTISKSGADATKFSVENGKLYYTGGSIDNTTTYTFNVSVSDGCNDPVVEEVSVTVKVNHKPTISPTSATICLGKSASDIYNGKQNQQVTQDLPMVVEDLDGDTITGVSFANPSGGNFKYSDGRITFTTTNNVASKSGFISAEYSFKTVTVNATVNTTNGNSEPIKLTLTLQSESSSAITGLTVSPTSATVDYGTSIATAISSVAPTSGVTISENLTSGVVSHQASDMLPVGTHTLTYTLTPEDGQCKTPATKTVTLTVNPKAITLTSSTDEQEYDGNPLENHTVTPSTALIGDDAFTYTNFASQTEVGETDNTFDVLPAGGTDLNNYTITKSYGTLTVTPVDLDADDFEIDASSKTVTYDKKAKELDFTATISDDDYVVYYEVEGVWTTTKPVVVGEYPAKVHVTGANYVNEDITSDDWKLIIEPKVVTLNWSPNNTFVYDGTEKTVTPSVNGVIEGDVCNVTDVTGNQATNVGAYSAEVTGLSNDNYTLFSSSFSWDITSKTINPFIPATPKDEDYKVTITSEGSFVYDATAKTPAVTVKVGDMVIPSTEYTVTYANNIDAGENTAEITIANATGGNYTVEGTTIYFSITPAPLTLTSENGTFTYDGTAHKKDVVTVKSGQLYGSDALTYSNFTEQTDVDTVPNKFAYAASGSTKLSNYTIDTLCGNLMVTPASMTLTCPTGSAVTKAYDGAALNPKATVSNTYGDDVIAISYSTDNGTSWNTSAPSITNVAESPLTVKVKAENANYKTETCSYTLSIDSATMEVTCPTAEASKKTYDGEALNPTASVDVTEGTTLSYSTDKTTWSTTVPSITEVSDGPKTVYVKAENANYKTETCSYELSISKALLTIEIADSKEYDGSW